MKYGVITRWRIIGLTSLIVLGLVNFSSAAETIWSEDFTDQEGKGLYGESTSGLHTDMDGITKWSVSGAGNLVDDTSLNWWMVTNGVFEGQDVGTSIGYWQSESIDVSDHGAVRIRMNLAKREGGCSTDTEYFQIGYKLDGDSAVTLLEITTDNQDSYNATGWISPDIDVSSASSIAIENKISINGASDGWSFDNVILESDSVPLLSPGDIYFTGYNTATNEDLAFALFEDVAAGTTLHFSNEEWNGLEIGSGGAFSTGGEAFSWYSGASIINAGAVVVFSDLSEASRSASVGSLAGENTSLNVSGDAIFCFYGSDSNTPTRFLAAIGNGTVPGTFTNLTGTGLVEDDTALALSSGTAIGAYTNTRSGCTKEQFKTLLVDEDNWIRQTDGNANGRDGIEPDAPFDSTPFTFATPASLNAGDIAFVGFDTSVDEFAFVAFTNIPQATVIVFTDNAWNTNTSSFANGEGSGTWTASSAVSAGSAITITVGGSASSGSWSQSGSFALAADGDPVLAYQGSAASPTFIAGIRAGSWSSTELPPTLTLGHTAVNFGNNTDSGYYYNIKTTGTVSSLKTAINNEAGWYTEGGDVTFPSWSFSIQASTPTLAAGDIAFIAYDLANSRFAFVAMTDIEADTEIAFTDIGWDKTDLVPDVGSVLEEHSAVWTAPEGGLSYGDVIRIQGTTVTGGGTMSGALDTFSRQGEQILAFQGIVTRPTFIAAISTYAWRTGASVVSYTYHSHLPSTLTEGQTAVQPTSTGVDHGRYYGERFAPRATLLPAINAKENWQLSATPQTWLTPWNFADTPLPTLFKFR